MIVVVIVTVAIEVSAIAVLLARKLLSLDDGVAIVRADEDIDTQVRSELEEVGRQQAFCPTNGVPALAVVLCGVHGVELRGKDMIAGVESGRVVGQDLVPVPEDLETLVTELRAHVLNHKRVPLNHGSPNSDAHRRAGGRKPLREPEAALDDEEVRLDEVEFAWP